MLVAAAGAAACAGRECSRARRAGGRAAATDLSTDLSTSARVRVVAGGAEVCPSARGTRGAVVRWRVPGVGGARRHLLDVLPRTEEPHLPREALIHVGVEHHVGNLAGRAGWAGR